MYVSLPGRTGLQTWRQWLGRYGTCGREGRGEACLQTDEEGKKKKEVEWLIH